MEKPNASLFTCQLSPKQGENPQNKQTQKLKNPCMGSLGFLLNSKK